MARDRLDGTEDAFQSYLLMASVLFSVLESFKLTSLIVKTRITMDSQTSKSLSNFYFF